MVFQSQFSFPLPGFEIDEVTEEENTVHVFAHLIQKSAVCPSCQQRSQHVHSHYQRSPADLPMVDQGGHLHLAVPQIEQAGCRALLTHPGKAKAMMGNVNKTDKLDARGLTTLLRNGTLPTIWIAPREVRDERELPRTRMALCKIRVALKNRIHATLAK
jgi:hypothetical protein